MNPRGFKASVRLKVVRGRAETPHRVNLCDMAMKYGDVLPVGEVEAWLEGRAYPEAARSGAVGVTR